MPRSVEELLQHADRLSWSAIGALVRTSGEVARQRYANKVASDTAAAVPDAPVLRVTPEKVPARRDTGRIASPS